MSLAQISCSNLSPCPQCCLSDTPPPPRSAAPPPNTGPISTPTLRREHTSIASSLTHATDSTRLPPTSLSDSQNGEREREGEGEGERVGARAQKVDAADGRRHLIAADEDRSMNGEFFSDIYAAEIHGLFLAGCI